MKLSWLAPKVLPWLFDDADHGVRGAVGAQLLADGVDAAKQVFLHVSADNADVRAVVFIRLGEVAPGCNVEVLQGRHLRGIATDAGVG